MIVDGVCVCFYCGETMDCPTKEQMKIFGKPKCCEYDMVVMDRNKIIIIVKALDKLKKNLEEQILKGML